jgi:hypothetical protein
MWCIFLRLGILVLSFPSTEVIAFEKVIFTLWRPFIAEPCKYVPERAHKVADGEDDDNKPCDPESIE